MGVLRILWRASKQKWKPIIEVVDDSTSSDESESEEVEEYFFQPVSIINKNGSTVADGTLQYCEIVMLTIYLSSSTAFHTFNTADIQKLKTVLMGTDTHEEAIPKEVFAHLAEVELQRGSTSLRALVPLTLQKESKISIVSTKKYIIKYLY